MAWALWEVSDEGEPCCSGDGGGDEERAGRRQEQLTPPLRPAKPYRRLRQALEALRAPMYFSSNGESGESGEKVRSGKEMCNAPFVVWLCGCVVSFGVYRVAISHENKGGRSGGTFSMVGGAQKKSARQASSPLDGLAVLGTKFVGNARENEVLERSQALSPDAVLLSQAVSPEAVSLSSVLSPEAVLLSSVLSQERSQLRDFRLHQGG